MFSCFVLYLIEILHQTTTCSSVVDGSMCCILSKFYIKPQPLDNKECFRNVVSYRNSTSNHNLWTTKSASEMLYLIEILHQTTTFTLLSFSMAALYLIEILHQTTTARQAQNWSLRCILSKFYIKPQLRLERELARCSCILSKFYIKPQLVPVFILIQFGCILSKFYIKPQPRLLQSSASWVVSYRNSTSNHNRWRILFYLGHVVSYRNSTSNHNFSPLFASDNLVVSYRNSTSNHNVNSIVI